ncbi:MAG TPA: PRC-barrel domain-containing protein [Stellaceae bacterium]
MTGLLTRKYVAVAAVAIAAATMAAPASAVAAESASEAHAPPKPKNLVPLNTKDTMGALGKKVFGPKGEVLGLIVDVIIDAAGHPQAAVIDFGGFLGVGSRKVAVDWNLLHFAPSISDRPVLLNLDRDQIQAAPAYKPDSGPVEMVGAPASKPPAAPDVPK